LDLIGWMAMFTTAASLVLLVVEVVLKIVDPSSAPKGFATLIVAILFIGGIQMVCLSVIGAYMAHMYEEIKARPPYIIDRVINQPAPRDSQNGSERNSRTDVEYGSERDSVTGSVAPGSEDQRAELSRRRSTSG
jgi:dolichol-phosphate mannosyltransferase